MPKYVCVQNIFVQSETKVEWGNRLTDGVNWTKVKDETVPANTTLRAGSVIEKEWPEFVVENLKAEGIIEDVSDAYNEKHYDLSIYADKVTYLGVPQTLAEVLNSHMIFSMEDIVNNKTGSIPFSESTSGKRPVPIKAHELLELFGNKTQVKKWIQIAQDAIKN